MSPILRPAETQTRPGPCPRKQDPSRASPAQRRNLTTATRPLPCPEAVALPPIPQLHNGSRHSAAISGGGCPARPIAAEAIWPTSHTPSQAVHILTRLIRSGADAGDPRCYGRMCRHTRPRLAAVQIEAFWPVWADAADGGVSGAVQDSHIELRSGARSGCPLT